MYTDGETGEEVGLAKQVGVDEYDFDTERGLQIRQLIKTWEAELGLSDVIGYSKFKYKKRGALSENNSLNRLWVYNIYPNVVYNDKYENTPFLFQNSGSLRDHMYKYEIYEDDVYTIMPFPNSIYVYNGLTGKEINCIVNKMNENFTDDGNSNPPYFVPGVADENVMYDLLTDDYNSQRISSASFDLCIKRNYRPELLPYQSKENVVSTDQVLRVYINKYLNDPEKLLEQVDENENDSVSEVANTVTAVFGVLIVLALVLLWK